MPYQILHNRKNIRDFENRVVFAPNGFGKTQFSLYLRDLETEEGKNVGLYTSREINDLVKMSDNQIFIGKYALVLKRIDVIRKAFVNNNPVHNLIKEYSDKTITDYYSSSKYNASKTWIRDIYK